MSNWYYYNLGFGDEDPRSGAVSDEVVINGDSQNVLATVARTVYEFIAAHPRASVIAIGAPVAVRASIAWALATTSQPSAPTSKCSALRASIGKLS